jgi:hypothetical protein
MNLNKEQIDKLDKLAAALVTPETATPLIMPYSDSDGYWFGSGNVQEGPDGALYVVGRYRNAGDSRHGLAAGSRGVELSVMRSEDGAHSFETLISLSKADLASEDGTVLSIEGAKLVLGEDGAELFTSTERTTSYPQVVSEFQKPGTGVWTIDRKRADSVAGLETAPVEPLLKGPTPETLHVKDPVVYRTGGGDTYLFFCFHPFNWSSSNTGLTIRPAGSERFGEVDYRIFPRGLAWDVAISRITAIWDVPRLGVFSDATAARLVFYDGGECMRNLEEHEKARTRPRGYSCEELAGLAASTDPGLGDIERISTLLPRFVSPSGTGCVRYIDVTSGSRGVYATWQQSTATRAQPLMMNMLSHDDVAHILS